MKSALCYLPIVAAAIGLTGCETIPPGAEHGPHGTMAFDVQIDASPPGARIQANGEDIGNTPVHLKVFGDPDGTFHDFGSSWYVIKALPLATNQFEQVRFFGTGRGFGPEDHIPQQITFNMNQPPPASPPYGPPVYGYPYPYYYGPPPYYAPGYYWGPGSGFMADRTTTTGAGIEHPWVSRLNPTRMRCRTPANLCLLGLVFVGESVLPAADLQFRHHFIARQLPTTDKGVGDYGLTALVDVDRDGDLDFVLGGRPARPSRLYWFEFQAPDRWAEHLVGTNYLSDVGLAPLDVDGDGWIDFVCSGVWYRNPAKPREREFERIVFDENGAGAHDIVIADMDRDGKPDVVMMGDERTGLNALCWYSIPQHVRQPWTRHPIGPPVHGAITPGGVADLDGDGDPDVVRADTWFENADGHGDRWVAHQNIPMGRKGPFGVCVRCAVLDLDGDGRVEVVIADADITDSKVVVLKNADGRGVRWEKVSLPQSFTYGSLHALAVADLNGDGRPDIISNEQEELLPVGRENPRWIVWENLGGLKFRERVILDAKLGGHELQVGDVDGDGDVDICSKPWGPRAWNGNAGKMHVDLLENLRRP